MKKHKIISILLTTVIVTSLTACGSQNADHSGGQSGTLENLQSGSGNAFK